MSSSRMDGSQSPAPRERPAALPTSAAEFEAYMQAMDRHFAAIGLPIAARSIAGMTEAGIDQGATRVRVPKKPDPEPDNYEGENLLLHAERWFRQRYPDHVIVDTDLGRTIVRVHGQLWLYRIPYGGWGQLLHTGDPLTSPATVQTPGGYPNILPYSPVRLQLPGVNLMEGIVGLPGDVAKSLYDADREVVLRAYCRGQLAFFWLTRARYHRFIREALNDCSTAVQHLLGIPPGLGVSRWASLQAVEKVLKSYLHYAGASFPTRGASGHNLSSLAELVIQAGGPSIAPEDIARVQCSASVRYDAGNLTPEDTLAAHHACLDVVDGVATELCNRFPLPTTPPIGDSVAEAHDRIRLIVERCGLSAKLT